MANKYDLKTVNVIPAAGVVNVGEEPVPADRVVPPGKTRFVCFIKHSAVTGGVIGIGEGDASETMTTVKDTTVLAAAAILAYPDKVDVDNPLLSVAEGKFLVAESTIADGTITVVYFDE